MLVPQLKPVPPRFLHPYERSLIAKKLTAILTPEATLCMLNEVATGGSLLDRQTENEFVQNIKQLQSSIRGYFVNRGADPADAEDLTQETLLQAFRGVESFRGEAEFKTWLFRIADNVFNKAIRTSKALKRGGQRTAQQDLLPLDRIPDHAAPSAATSANTRSPRDGHQLRKLLVEERLGLTRKALAGLPTKMQRCFLLYIHQERKYHEIAALMDLSINTVKSHIHQARKRLKKAVGDS